MKEETLKLADELQDYMTSLGWKTHQAPNMIRRLVEELNKKPLSNEEIKVIATQNRTDLTIPAYISFARLIEERHGIK